MQILVRLPNWLGDTVMSLGVMNSLRKKFPEAQIDIIAKKELQELMPVLFPFTRKSYLYSKAELPSIWDVIKFGRMIKRQATYDLYICLPSSLSAAVMGWATGAHTRVGYTKDTGWLFHTKSIQKPMGMHRVLEFQALLECYVGEKLPTPEVFCTLPAVAKKEQLIVNFNSEASSRRFPLVKGITVIEKLLKEYNGRLLLIGSSKDVPFTQAIHKPFLENDRVVNMAGKTPLNELIHLMSESKAVLSVDSGSAHLANAIGVQVIDIHGADDEKNTVPYNSHYITNIRYGKLPCEPCVKNICPLYDSPKCLDMLSEDLITQTVLSKL